MFKDYLEYRKNKRIAIRELAQMLSTAMPSIREFIENRATILDMVKHTALVAKNMEGSELVDIVVDSLSDIFSVNHERFIEVGSYLMGLSPEDMQKIIVHSMVETMQKDTN